MKPISLRRAIKSTSLMLKKNSRAILTVAESIGIVGTGVSSFIAAVKYEKTMKDYEEEMAALEINKPLYSEEEYAKEVKEASKGTAVKLVKIFSVPVAIGGLTIAGVACNHKISSKRISSLASAYALEHAARSRLFNNVKAKYGNDEALKLSTDGAVKETVEIISDEEGNETVNTTVDFVNTSDDMIRFDISNVNWKRKDRQFTIKWLLSMEKTLTMKLRADGYLFLNDVREAIGVSKTPAGQIIGWIYNPYSSDDPLEINNFDNCVSFGIDFDSDNYKDFISGKSDYIWLSLNHDGNIYDVFPRYSNC